MPQLTVRSCWFESLAISNSGIIVDDFVQSEDLNKKHFVVDSAVDNLSKHLIMNDDDMDPFNDDVNDTAEILLSLLELLPILGRFHL